jgi:hypothetical protein
MAIDPLASLARAQRAFEHINLLRVVHGEATLQGRWVAISLADGSVKQELYADKKEAVRFQFHETQCAYLCINGFPTLGEMRFFLDANEDLYDQGLSLSDPDHYVNPEFLL